LADRDDEEGRSSGIVDVGGVGTLDEEHASAQFEGNCGMIAPVVPPSRVAERFGEELSSDER
jgi:hypothetical protein